MPEPCKFYHLRMLAVKLGPGVRVPAGGRQAEDGLTAEIAEFAEKRVLPTGTAKAVPYSSTEAVTYQPTNLSDPPGLPDLGEQPTRPT